MCLLGMLRYAKYSTYSFFLSSISVDVEWVPTTVETFDKIKNRALVGGYEATGKRVYVIRSVVSHTKNTVPGFFVENDTKAMLSCCSTPEQYEVQQFDVSN